MIISLDLEEVSEIVRRHLEARGLVVEDDPYVTKDEDNEPDGYAALCTFKSDVRGNDDDLPS